MRFAANVSLIGCALGAVGLAGCSALLDTGSLTGGRRTNGSSGMSSGGDEPTLSDAGSFAAGGDESGGSATAGSAGSSAGGSSSGGGGGSESMAGGSAGGATAGAGGAVNPCVKTNGGKEICDGVDNDCNSATPDCPAGCTAFVARGINYMACDKLDDWTSAELACFAQRMEVAAILSAAENAAVTAELQTLNLGTSAWLGGDSEIQSNNTLEWPDGTIVSKNGVPVAGVYHNFASGQPKNMSAENALQISIGTDASAGQWSNALVSVSQPFVCKALGL
ncbi:MAG TPA: C-type lectin domain-containing protein [Polyangiaceae bacterium]